MTTQDQVNEILAILGTDPEGVYANVRVRLDILEARINNPNAPAPNVTNPFYLDGYGGTSISVGDGYPTETRTDGSVYLRRDGYSFQAIYIRRDGAWEETHKSMVTVGVLGTPTSEYLLPSFAQDGYAVYAFVAPRAGNLKNMRLKCRVAAGSGESVQVQTYINGVLGNLDATLTGDTGADITNVDTVQAGDGVSFLATYTAGSTPTPLEDLTVTCEFV